MVLHLQSTHPVRFVRSCAVRQDLLHAGCAGDSADRGRLHEGGNGGAGRLGGGGLMI